MCAQKLRKNRFVEFRAALEETSSVRLTWKLALALDNSGEYIQGMNYVVNAADLT